MGVIIANDVLMDVGIALLEVPVNTSSGTLIIPGVQAVAPVSMAGICVGAVIAIGANGSEEQEAVTVTSMTTSTFTATFVNNHAVGDPITGMGFSAGQPDNALFSQAEVLGYMMDAQQDFLLKVRPVYAVGSVTLQVGKKVYAAPADSIRVERASIVNMAATPPSAVELYNTTQTDLDLLQGGWGSSSGPTAWYQDQISPQSIGVGPPPSVGDVVTVFYSQRATGVLGILSKFLMPDAMTIAVKWRTLAVCYSKEGEMRDPAKAAFAQQLFEMIVMASQKFMSGVDARVKMQEETVEPLAGQRM